MKKTYLFVFCFYLILVLGIFNKSVLKTKASFDLFNEVLQDTKSEVLEYGLRVTFPVVVNDGEKECMEIFKGLNLSNNKKVDISSDKNIYTLDFRTDDFSGYINYIKSEDYGTITIDIVENKSVLELNELRDRIDDAVKDRNGKRKYFQYIKAKTELKDITYAKDIVVDLLQKKGAVNIETIDLDKGSSITAYTGYYEQMKKGRRLIDFNCAVFSYESGNYVIIGTPIIMSSY